MQCRSKKRNGDSGINAENEVLQTEEIVFVATQIGLTVADFEHMTIGMIFDHIITYNNNASQEKTEARIATVEDMAAF